MLFQSSDLSEFIAVFMVFNFWIGLGFIFQSATLGLDLFSGEHHNKLPLLWYPVTENCFTEEVHQLRCFFA